MAKRFKVTSSSKNMLLVLLFALIAIWGVRLKFSRNEEEKQPAPIVQSQIVDSSQTAAGKALTNDFQPQANPISYGNYVVRTVVVTGIMLALIFGMYVFSKRRFKSDSAMVNDIKVIGRRYLNNKQYLMIVQAGKKKMLLGITDHNINFLSELNDGTGPDETDETMEDSGEEAGAFGNILKKINITSEDLE